MMAGPTAYSSVTLGQLLPEFSAIEECNFSVGRLVLDSRQVSAGDCFVAVAGSQVDGADYIEAAIENGAQTILHAGDTFKIDPAAGSVSYIQVPELSARLSDIAGRWYGEPSKDMQVVAITGTNGKTTCSQWLAQLLNSEIAPAASVGTLGYGMVGDELVETGLTTPDPVRVQSILSDFRNVGVKRVVMEASSHSLEQHRIAGVDIDVAVFTNIGRDHLDYHGDMENYVAAKTQLMGFSSVRAAVINADDAYADQFVAALQDGVRLITFGRVKSAMVSAAAVEYLPNGIKAELTIFGEVHLVHLNVWGDFNLSNILAVIAAALACGLNAEDIVERLPNLTAVPGRLQSIERDADISVLVDFAHTADALESVLTAIRAHSRQQLWCIFGCGGDRDKGKRALMAATAERLADKVVVTSDNPRTENPQQIIDEVLAGFEKPDVVTVDADRAAAIDDTLARAVSGDCVLIAGKGHENYQIIGEEKIEFSDLLIADQALERRLVRGAQS
ncbi:MAG: UDP-N-acetylmuramoyl-L-alanyl-D-glutamate--2,6-diaminopimelate ligase [Cellvibrionaceae bacterium]|nr:UDP-N-acetylmuramoyl-L-alanyl-D-glutamate--2,6-diaminopimelate ligase [Cellvibrionaceae bacterium]|tara:strand:+ start:25085 stop:26596 length:1512 start_codon:yes stop_codon:yes gene_type:complete